MECPARPKTVRFVPEGEGAREGERTRLKWTWKAGRLRVTVPRLEIHGVVVVD
jgi:hypothetical protein